MMEIPKEILEYGGNAAVLVWVCVMGWATVAGKIKVRNGHMDATERGMMLKAVLRSTEEVKEHVHSILTTQAVQTESMKRIEHKIEDHDSRLRGVEIKAGRM
jgi:hypothetical protein